ncbi:MAG: prolyl aminopeptidase [Endozoicomonadaceae bacterium]|nr:prolyl aminopeptidase [Endozoicomonadaceae bacterium]MCY4328897.1 prolyl aminopeptidase [Endozoicomonadaceae bacterium]
MRTLYPSIKPHQHYYLQVDDQHKLCFDESGNSKGIPVVFLHGGPGDCYVDHGRRYFDPDFYRIINLDQRGCGRSVPHGDLQNNTTQDLILDLEQVRKHLNIDRWMLLGGGWGATLAVLYAQHYPDKVLAVIAAGFSLCRRDDLNWLYGGGIRRIFPDYWKEFVEKLDPKEQEQPLLAYYNHLTADKNELMQMSLAKSWGAWIIQCATLKPDQEALDHYVESNCMLTMAKIATHFAVNNFFIRDNYILDNINKIKHIPGILVHGRYDMVAPTDNVFQLSEQWSAAESHIVRDAGHLLTEPGIQDALVRATGVMAKRFKSEFNIKTTS